MDREYLNWALLFVLITVVFFSVMFVRAKLKSRAKIDNRKQG